MSIGSFKILTIYLQDDASPQGHHFSKGELSSKIIDYHSTNNQYSETQDQEWRKLNGVSDFNVAHYFMFKAPITIGKDNSWHMDNIYSVEAIQNELQKSSMYIYSDKV